MKAIRFLTTVLLASLLPLQFAAAEMSAKQTVEEILSKMKAAESPAPVVDYVDWKGAYEKMPAAQRQAVGVESAEGLRSFYSKMMTNPKEVMEKKLEEQLASMPEEKKSMMRASMGRMEQMVDQRQEMMRKQLAETEYKVGEATMEGEVATVPITQTHNGETKQRDIKLTKVDGRWLLDSATMFEEGTKAMESRKQQAMPQMGQQLKGAMQKGQAAPAAQ